MYRNIFYDSKKGIVHIFGWDENGSRTLRSEPFSPYFLLEDMNGQFMSIFDTPLEKKEFKNNFERKKAEQSCSNKRIFGNIQVESQYLIEKYWDTHENEEFSKHPLSIWFLDIEVYVSNGMPKVEEANDEITLITWHDSLSGKVVSLGTKDYTSKSGDSVYLKCRDEAHLLKVFVSAIQKSPPDVITGWNVEWFDLPYIYFRVEAVLGEEWASRMSPFFSVFEKDTISKFGQASKTISIAGVSILDYYDLYQIFTQKKQPSYKLDFIANEEIGESKIPYDGSLNDLFDSDFEKYVDYNIQDVKLIVKLEKKLQYLELCRMLAYAGLTPFESAKKTIGVVTGAIAVESYKRGKYIPTFKDLRYYDYEGGFVMSPRKGFSDGVVSFDANSLYPSTMVSLNISPETKVGSFLRTKSGVEISLESEKKFVLTEDRFKDFLKVEQMAVSSANIIFSQKKEGLVPSIIKRFYAERVEIKKQMKELKQKLKTLSGDEKKKCEFSLEQKNIRQYTIKIFLNRIYGYFGNQYSPMLDIDLAKSITISGQDVVKESGRIGIEWVSQTIGKDSSEILVYQDTDSAYFSLEKFFNHYGESVKKEKLSKRIYEICDEFQSNLNAKIDEWARKTYNALNPVFVFKREAICKTAFFFDKKKNYVLHVLDDEGIPCDKMKYVGEKTKMTTSAFPPVFKPFLKDFMKVFMETQDRAKCQKKIFEIVESVRDMDPVKMSKITKVQNYDKYCDGMDDLSFKKGTPVHVKAAYNYNFILSKLGLENRYSKIVSGDKIRWVYLKQNIYGMQVMAFKDEFPEEFRNMFFIDKEKSFQQIFYDSIDDFYNTLGWDFQKENFESACDLESFLSD